MKRFSTFSIKVEDVFLEEINEYCEEHGMVRNRFIVEMVKRGILNGEVVGINRARNSGGSRGARSPKVEKVEKVDEIEELSEIIAFDGKTYKIPKRGNQGWVDWCREVVDRTHKVKPFRSEEDKIRQLWELVNEPRLICYFNYVLK